MKSKILDCTLRDGGYYNSWNFPMELVQAYLVAIADVVDVVELGLRQFPTSQFLGAHAFTTNAFLKRLNLPEGPLYGVMVDAKTLIESGLGVKASVDALFQSAESESFKLVRIAAHFSELDGALEAACALKAKGFMVGLNLMQASLQSESSIKAAAEKVEHCGEIDVLYFADSLGDMAEDRISGVILAIRAGGWTGDIGFHAHNNMGSAVTNVDAAVKKGCSWIDATVTGMGRGAGNAETEFVLLRHGSGLSQRQQHALVELIESWFKPLKVKYGWGASYFYFLGAQRKLHPTYIQRLSEDKKLSSQNAIQTIEDLARVETPHKFNDTTYESCIARVVSGGFAKFIAEKPVTNLWQGREIVLVANTETSREVTPAVADYVDAKNAILCSINLPSTPSSLNFDFVFISHNRKVREEESRYRSAKYKFIAPKSAFMETGLDITIDYGLAVSAEEFKPTSSVGYIPFHLTIAYAIAFCSAANAAQISLVGFDGYQNGGDAQKQMGHFWRIFRGSCGLSVVSLTKTTYPIDERSIYAL